MESMGLPFTDNLSGPPTRVTDYKKKKSWHPRCGDGMNRPHYNRFVLPERSPMPSRLFFLRAPALLLLVGLLACIAGCGGGGASKLIPVKGKVTLNGQPLAAGTLTFHPDESKGNTAKLPMPPVGTIKDGEYTLATGKFDGAPPGWYKVTVHADVPSNPKDEYSEPRSLINRAYNEPYSTALQVEVKPDAPPGWYDLKLQ
jgi:hypothetical protein